MKIPLGSRLALATLLVVSSAQADWIELKRGADDAYDARRYRDAARGYEAAYAEKKDPSVLYNLARTYEALGRDVEALDCLQRFEEHAPFEVRRKVPKLEGLLAVYRTRVATVEISSNVTAARIVIRNVESGETSTEPRRIQVAVGNATIEVSKEGYDRWSRTLALEGASVTHLEVNLTPSEIRSGAGPSADRATVEPPRPTPFYQTWWFWTAAGAAAAIATTAVLLTAFSTENAPPRGTYGRGNTVVWPLVTF